MRPILFSLGRLNFYSYGLFTAIGFIAGGAVVDYLARRKRLLTKKHRDYFLIDGLLIALMAAIVSARLAFIVLYNLIFKIETFTSLLTGGFVFYAGLFVGLLTFAWWIRRAELPVLRWLDALMTGILVGYTVSQIGGYLNDGLFIHLVGLGGGLVLSGIAYWLYMIERKPGTTFLISLFLLFSFFFFADFWHTESIIWFGLTLGQWVSLVGLAVIGWWRARHALQVEVKPQPSA